MTLEELKIRQMTNQYLLAPADKLTVSQKLSGSRRSEERR